MKRKVVKAWAVIFEQTGFSICGYKRKFDDNSLFQVVIK